MALTGSMLSHKSKAQKQPLKDIPWKELFLKL